MREITARQFVEVIGGTFSGAEAPADLVVRHAAVHSDRLGSASAFFALPGSTANGRDFVGRALANGASLAVVAPSDLATRADAVPPGPVVVVDDCLAALQRLAAWWRSQLSATVVAVGGSNGKTITKDAMGEFLSLDRRVYASPGSYNSQLGVALSVLECPEDVDVALIEVAASEPGEMERLSRILRPDRVVITNLGRRWESNFPDRAGHAAELARIAASVPAAGWVLLGEPNDELMRALETTAGRILTANDSPELPRFSPPTYGGTTSSCEVSIGSSVFGLNVATVSLEIVADVLTALSAAYLLGASVESLREVAAAVEPTSTRVEIWRAPSGVTVVRDVATPDPIAVGSALRSARRLTAPDRVLGVVLVEPPTAWDDENAAALGNVLSAEGVDVAFAVSSPFVKTLADALARQGGPSVETYATTQELLRGVIGRLKPGDVVLVQTARSMAMSDLATELMEAMAPTRLYLDLSAIEDNVATFRRVVGTDVRILGVVKALAYGTDSLAVSAALQEAGVEWLAVSAVDEGMALRRAGIHVPLLVMLGWAGQVEKMLRFRLTPVLYSAELATAVLEAARLQAGEISVHIEIDTGMHRTGFSPAEAIALMQRLHAEPNVRVTGLMTHMACADDPAEDHFSRLQLSRFAEVTAAAEQLGLRNVIRHAAATSATLRFPNSHFDMVRLGLGLYGLHPSEATRERVELVPAVGLVSRIVEILTIDEHERVGYGQTFSAGAGGARLAVVPAGYHDCVPRAFSNVGYVMVGAVRCPIAGIVSMDSMTIDVTHCPDAEVGSDVLIYGRQGERNVPLEEVSRAIGTIPYELLTRVAPRVQRIFTRH